MLSNVKQGKIPGRIQYKARYVARGYSQTRVEDYEEAYFPATRFTSIRMLLQKAVNDNLYLHQLDVKRAYLNAPIDKDIYVQQPSGCEKTISNDTYPTDMSPQQIVVWTLSGCNWHTTFTEIFCQ